MSVFADDDVVVASTARTPIGRARKGSLVSMRPDDLAVIAFGEAVRRVPGLTYDDVDDLYLGNAEPYGEHGQNIARRVAILLGSDRLPGATVNRFCSSSVLATRMAFHALKAGEGDAYLVGGVECTSRNVPEDPQPNPLFDGTVERVQQQLASGTWTDPRGEGLLPAYYVMMGLTAELVARQTGTTRQMQDEFAALSQQRAVASWEAGFFDNEIVPVTLADGTVVTKDDGPRPGTTVETLSGLNPVFIPDGTVTAGNACPLNDGASAAVLMTGRKAKELGIQPRARILSSGVSALSPELMGLGPIGASRQALGRAGLTAADIDVMELNEAFAAQVVPSAKEIGVPIEKTNPHGGAIALGHPFGSTGTRMLGTLINDLHTDGGQFGLLTLCVGGGQGMALVVEALRD